MLCLKKVWQLFEWLIVYTSKSAVSPHQTMALMAVAPPPFSLPKTRSRPINCRLSALQISNVHGILLGIEAEWSVSAELFVVLECVVQ